eukprot:1525778-Karenia_brevis.AAC.1
MHEDDTNITHQVEEATSRALQIGLKSKEAFVPANVLMENQIMNVNSASSNVDKPTQDTLPDAKKATVTFEQDGWAI